MSPRASGDYLMKPELCAAGAEREVLVPSLSARGKLGAQQPPDQQHLSGEPWEMLRPLCPWKPLSEPTLLGGPLSFFILIPQPEPAHPEAGTPLPCHGPAWRSRSECTYTHPGFLCLDWPCSWAGGDRHTGRSVLTGLGDVTGTCPHPELDVYQIAPSRVSLGPEGRASCLHIHPWTNCPD